MSDKIKKDEIFDLLYKNFNIEIDRYYVKNIFNFDSINYDEQDIIKLYNDNNIVIKDNEEIYFTKNYFSINENNIESKLSKDFCNILYDDYIVNTISHDEFIELFNALNKKKLLDECNSIYDMENLTSSINIIINNDNEEIIKILFIKDEPIKLSELIPSNDKKVSKKDSFLDSLIDNIDELTDTESVDNHLVEGKKRGKKASKKDNDDSEKDNIKKERRCLSEKFKVLKMTEDEKDDELTICIKQAINDLQITLEDLYSVFDSKSEAYNFYYGLSTRNTMSWKTFNQWCNKLGIKYNLSIKFN